MIEILRKLWRDPAYFVATLAALALFGGIYLAQPDGRPWYERAMLAASVAAGGGLAVGKSARNGPGGAAPVIALLAGVGLLGLGCGTLPTSSSATNEETKGGAFSGPSIEWDEPDGPRIRCAGGTPELPCRLTDPPSGEELGVVGKLGEAVRDVILAPLEILGALGRAAAGVAPAAAPPAGP